MGKSVIGVVVTAKNEASQIRDCIESSKLLTKTIVLIDTGSTDETKAIAEKMGVTVFDFPNHQYVEPSRKFAIEKTPADWILILDADERITKELSDEILSTINTKYQIPNTSYRVPRKNIFGRRKWLKYGGWWPDAQIRLIHKSSFVDWPKQIHSTPQVQGAQGILNQPLLHYFHGDFESMVEKTVVYEQIEAQLLFEGKKSASSITFFRKFLGELMRRLIIKHGFMDGQIGIMESVYQAFSKTTTYLFLYEKKIHRPL